eukprot:g16114.t1
MGDAKRGDLSESRTNGHHPRKHGDWVIHRPWQGQLRVLAVVLPWSWSIYVKGSSLQDQSSVNLLPTTAWDTQKMGDVERSRKAMEQSMLDMKLQETGERERLKEYITTQLNESGWREELKKQCVAFIQEKGFRFHVLPTFLRNLWPLLTRCCLQATGSLRMLFPWRRVLQVISGGICWPKVSGWNR